MLPINKPKKNKICTYQIFLFIFILQLFFCAGAFAHKVNIFAYIDGNTIYSQSYFSDGRKCKNAKVHVYDFKGNRFLEGITDNEGNLSFKLPILMGGLKLVLNAGMGHKAEYEITIDNILPYASGKVLEENNPAINISKLPLLTTGELNTEQIEKIINTALDKKLRPVMLKLTRLESRKISVADILSGFGYILGLMGIGIYFRYKYKERKSP